MRSGTEKDSGLPTNTQSLVCQSKCEPTYMYRHHHYTPAEVFPYRQETQFSCWEGCIMSRDLSFPVMKIICLLSKRKGQADMIPSRLHSFSYMLMYLIFKLMTGYLSKLFWLRAKGKLYAAWKPFLPRPPKQHYSEPLPKPRSIF